jgi:arginyl-tRNA synthetase
MYNEEWPDIDEYVKSDLVDDVNKPSTIAEPSTTSTSGDEKHMAAMELAPSKIKPNKVTEFVEEIAEKIEDKQESEKGEMVRIKIIQSLPDAVMLGDGVELVLEEDDIHFIDKDTADWLIESGVAEIENL